MSSPAPPPPANSRARSWSSPTTTSPAAWPRRSTRGTPPRTAASPAGATPAVDCGGSTPLCSPRRSSPTRVPRHCRALPAAAPAPHAQRRPAAAVHRGSAANSLQGAGGIGGLLFLDTWEATAGRRSYLPGFDGNGNHVTLSTADAPPPGGRPAGSLTAEYAYAPFGERLAAAFAPALGAPTRAAVAAVPLGFSTKYRDPESGLLYYGYRYYCPATGRWLNRDPKGEKGGLNGYGFIGNSVPMDVDPFGLAPLSQDDLDSLLGQLQKIANDVSQMEPPTRCNSPDKIGVWRHDQFAQRVQKLNSPYILLEQSINSAGMAVSKPHWHNALGEYRSKWPSGSRRPDVMILGDTLEDVAGGSKKFSLVDKVAAIVDLKTGKQDIEKVWADDVMGRIEISRDRIVALRAGGDLAGDFKFIARVVKWLDTPAARAIKTTGAHALAIGAGVWAYNKAREEGKMPNEARLAALAAVTNLDLVTNAQEYAGSMFWYQAENLARSNPYSRWINAASAESGDCGIKESSWSGHISDAMNEMLFENSLRRGIPVSLWPN